MKPKDLVVAFGARVHQLRKAKGLTQEELGVATGVTVDAISSMERGLTGPRLHRLAQIADALDVSLSELFAIAPVPRTAAERTLQGLREELADLGKGLNEAALRQAVAVVRALAETPKVPGKPTPKPPVKSPAKKAR